MRNILTTGEKSLVQAGAEKRVLELRQEFQQIMSDELVALVEEQVGQKVVAFMSNNHTDPDLAVEIFVLG